MTETGNTEPTSNLPEPSGQPSAQSPRWGLREILIAAAIGLGIYVFYRILRWLFSPTQRKYAPRPKPKPHKKKVFIGFAAEDSWARDKLCEQVKNERSPFDFEDMSIKEPFDRAWKTQCRQRIQGCDGMIAMLSTNTWDADGARWEILCARQENVPVMGMHIFKHNKGAVPPELNGCKVREWKWVNLQEFVDSL